MDTTVYKGWLELVHREVNGRKYEVVKQKPAVAAVVFNKEDDSILLVKQYRPALKKETWEIPAGMMDVDGENPCDCLIREIKEETDVTVDTDSLVKFVSYYPNGGSSDHKLTLYTCTAKEKMYESKYIDDADVTEAKWFSMQEVCRMIDDGEIDDSKTIIGCQTFNFKADL